MEPPSSPAEVELARLRARVERLERELEEARAGTQAIERLFAALPVFVVCADAADRITYLNRVADPSLSMPSIVGTNACMACSLPPTPTCGS